MVEFQATAEVGLVTVSRFRVRLFQANILQIMPHKGLLIMNSHSKPLMIDQAHPPRPESDYRFHTPFQIDQRFLLRKIELCTTEQIVLRKYGRLHKKGMSKELFLHESKDMFAQENVC